MKQPIWKLVQLCAQELTETGITSFRRGDIIRYVQRYNPQCGADSINPIIQGLTDNLRGGAPGAVGKNILHSVARGRFVLKEGTSQGEIPSQTEVKTKKDSSKGKVELQSISPDGVEMQLGDYTFHHICALVPDVKPDGSILEIMPQDSYKNLKGLPLNKYGAGPFSRFRIPKNLDFCGVYAVFVDCDLKYIGECEVLSSRFNTGYGQISPKNCYAGGQETNCRINTLVLQQARAGAKISLWFLATNEHKTIEQELRSTLSTDWNLV